MRNANLLQANKSFRDAIMNDTTPVVSGEDGLKALEVAEMILRAIEEGIA
jgi:predicted dehydrogenase